MRVAAAAFSVEPVTDPEVLDVLFREVAGHDWAGEGTDLVTLAVDERPVPSKSEARRAIAQGGLSVNGVAASVDRPAARAVAGRYHLVLRQGRKRLVVVRRERS